MVQDHHLMAKYDALLRATANDPGVDINIRNAIAQELLYRETLERRLDEEAPVVESPYDTEKIPGSTTRVEHVGPFPTEPEHVNLSEGTVVRESVDQEALPHSPKQAHPIGIQDAGEGEEDDGVEHVQLKGDPQPLRNKTAWELGIAGDYTESESGSDPIDDRDPTA